jgi:hypothetical protein
MEVQAVQAKSRQLLHTLDEKIAVANEQQGLSLLAMLTELCENAYEAVEPLKFPLVESKRGRPSSTKRLPLAVERSSQEYKKEKKLKIALAKKQKDVASANLKANTAAIVDLTKHVRLHLESIVNGTIALNKPSYLPYESTMDIFNPRADGNCGFRALPKDVYSSEEQWRQVKDDLLGTYIKDAALYQDVQGFHHSKIMDVLTNRAEVLIKCFLFRCLLHST